MILDPQHGNNISELSLLQSCKMTRTTRGTIWKKIRVLLLKTVLHPFVTFRLGE